MWLELGLLFLGLLRLQLLGADTAATGHRRAQPNSLAPGLDYPVSFQHEVPPAIGGPVLGEQTVYVDCDRGSDSAHGLSAAAALRTLPAAQRVARQARARRASWALSQWLSSHAERNSGRRGARELPSRVAARADSCG